MKRILFLFSLFTIHHSLFSQQTLIATVTDIIKLGQYDYAGHYLDSVLKKEPNNVDALMMKGNVILNRDLLALPEPTTFTANDEFIFNSEELRLDKRKVVPEKTLAEVEALWNKCLKLDSTRTDIVRGLCTIYAMALKKDAVKKGIVALMRAEKDDGEQAYKMNQYGDKFAERGKFDDAVEIYVFIAKQYPALAGLRCDIASQFFYQGKMNEALTWLDSAYNFKNVDETTFLNGAFIYSELGYFDNAQDVLNTYSRIYDRKMHTFYFGLRQFSDSVPGYYETLKYFADIVDTNAYYSEYLVAKKLLPFKDVFTLSDYKTLAADNDIPDFYKVLIHQRAVKQFAAQCDPFLIYGVYHNSIKNYSASVQLLEDGEYCKMTAAQTEFWMLNYGFALYMTGNKEKALQYLNPLALSGDAFTAHASKYFTAKILLEQNKKEEAKALLQSISTSAQKTRYSFLAEIVLRTL